MENTDTNEIENKDTLITDDTIDSVIFSVTYDNYQKNIKNDREHRTVGEWAIVPGNFQKIKYGYTYLKGSDKMVVKKFHIQNFEYSKKEKGFNTDWKVCFVFSHSEDMFFEFPYNPVQSRQYVSSSVLDGLPRLLQDEINRRLDKSRLTPVVEYTTISRPPRQRKFGDRPIRSRKVIETTREKIFKVYQEKFSNHKNVNFRDVNTLIQKVDSGSDIEFVLNEYFASKEKKQS
jgi:hypothetical protein